MQHKGSHATAIHSLNSRQTRHVQQHVDHSSASQSNQLGSHRNVESNRYSQEVLNERYEELLDEVDDWCTSQGAAEQSLERLPAVDDMLGCAADAQTAEDELAADAVYQEPGVSPDVCQHIHEEDPSLLPMHLQQGHMHAAAEHGHVPDMLFAIHVRSELTESHFDMQSSSECD